MSKTKLIILVIFILSFFVGIVWGYLEDNSNLILETSDNAIISNHTIEYLVTNDFITNSKGKDVFEKFCKDINIEVIEPTKMADSWNYENGNLNSSLQINSDKSTDEIYYIKLMAAEETILDDFLKVCELEYKNNDVEKAKNWVKDNIGSKSSKSIGKMYFNLSAPLGNPILEIYTLNGKKYESEQESASIDF